MKKLLIVLSYLNLLGTPAHAAQVLCATKVGAEFPATVELARESINSKIIDFEKKNPGKKFTYKSAGAGSSAVGEYRNYGVGHFVQICLIATQVGSK